ENKRIHTGRCLVGMRLQPGDQFAQVLRWLRFSRNKHNRTCGERRDWFKIFQHIVGKRVERAVMYKRAVKTETNRVAIRLRAGSATDADASVSSADVLNDDRLPNGPRIRSAMIRAITSVAPPAGKGTIIVIGRVG